MNLSQKLSATQGLTHLEALTVIAIIALAVAATVPYILQVRQKASLVAERDNLLELLNVAQQRSIAVYKGHYYAVELHPPRNFRLVDDAASVFENHNIRGPVTISSPTSATTVSFTKLTGKPNATQEITLSSTVFDTKINIEPEGQITTTPPIRR